jgi:hypothetical protein
VYASATVSGTGRGDSGPDVFSDSCGGLFATSGTLFWWGKCAKDPPTIAAQIHSLTIGAITMNLGALREVIRRTMHWHTRNDENTCTLSSHSYTNYLNERVAFVRTRPYIPSLCFLDLPPLLALLSCSQ